MIFWTLITLIAAATITTVIRSASDRWNDTTDHVMSGILALVISFVVSGLVFVGCSFAMDPIHKDVARDDTYQLRALGTSTGLEGHSYFLGGGYIKDKRVLNYITDENGAIRVQQSNADVSTIYEDTTKPTVNIKHYNNWNEWLMPFPVPTHDEYTFHIPAGSVMSDYAVTNK